MKRFIPALLLLSFVACCTKPSSDSLSSLLDDFRNPPQDARPLVWWHWMNGNITEDGIRKDILWMHDKGIGGFQLFDAGLDTPQIVENRLDYMSEGWKKALRTAVSLADSLGMEVGIPSSAGWSSTGGPWVAPEDAMKKLCWRTMELDGGKPYEGPLPTPLTVSSRFQDIDLPFEPNNHQNGPISEWYYDDIAVIALRIPDSGNASGRLSAGEGWSQLEFDEPYAAKAVSIRYAKARSGGHAQLPKCKDTLLTSDDGIHFHVLCGIPRGAVQQQTHCIPQTAARFWRLKRAEDTAPEFCLYGNDVINHFEEKAGFAASCYLAGYPTSPDASGCETLDITSAFKDGVLQWNAPEGRWRIYRFGCSLVGKKNHPASPEATGLEVDKLDKAAFSRYLHKYLDNYKEAAGGMLGKRGIRYLLIDSYESGGQNWTPGLKEEFLRRRGYDLVKWLPAAAGAIVGSTAESEQFLLDLRLTIGELFAENYANASDIVRKDYGMQGIYIESHEHGRSFPSDGMSIKKSAAWPMSAMWIKGASGVETRLSEGKADIRESASVADIYGQNKVAAESFTANGSNAKAYTYCPDNLKLAADLEMGAGVNRFVIHESTHQPLDKGPGLGLGVYGQWFNRLETWADQAGAWTEYLARSCAMLQKGRNVADLLYYYGEDTNITAQFSRNELKLPFGYCLDFAGPEVLLNEISVRNGKLVSRSGMEYSTLYVGEHGKMSEEIRSKIESFKKAGARIIDGKWPHYVFGQMDPDVSVSCPEGMQYVHRTLPDTEIYWLSNTLDLERHEEVSLRTSGRKPQLWHPETGKVSDVSYRFENGRTVIPLEFGPEDAFFIVLGGKTDVSSFEMPKETLVGNIPMDGSWKVTFAGGKEVVFDSLQSWTESPDNDIKYYSGTADYSKTFEFSPKDDFRYVLDLGKVCNIASVRLNGVSLGTAWHHPFRIDLTPALKEGENNLEIEVSNLWPNRIIGELRGAGNGNTSGTPRPFFKADDTLLPSGLTSPVRIEIMGQHPDYSAFSNPAFAKELFEDPAAGCLNARPYDLMPGEPSPEDVPDGYKAVYISHYGRHGARSGSPASMDLPNFESLRDILAQADKEGILAPDGKQLLAEVSGIITATNGMEGRLTPRGQREHRGIAQRMYVRFSELLSGHGAHIDAFGSIYPRCIVSMASFTNALKENNPSLDINMDSGEKYQSFLHNDYSPEIAGPRNRISDSLRACINPDLTRTMSRLFTDACRGAELAGEPAAFAHKIFRAGRICRTFDLDYNLFRFLPFEAVYDWAEYYNMRIFLGHGNSSMFGKGRLANTEFFVRDIVSRADKALAGGGNVADLRFGHDYSLLALCERLGLDDLCNVYDLQGAMQHFTASSYIPFAANLQIAFYKSSAPDAPVLVKCLLNEKECRIDGLQAVEGCYYKWNDLRAKLIPSHPGFCLEAHRGISNRYPENTVLAFSEAAKVPWYGGMETDVQESSDGVLVLMHDDYLERTTDGVGKVSFYTWDQLQRMHITGGYGWNEAFAVKCRIPLFTEYLDICRNAGLVPYVELKLLSDEGIAKTIRTLHEKGFKDDEYVLTSFTRHYLEVARGLCDAKLEYMQGSFTDAELEELADKGFVIRPDSKKIDQRTVDKCAELGLELECWGLPVGGKDILERLVGWGVKGVTCNDWTGLI